VGRAAELPEPVADPADPASADMIASPEPVAFVVSATSASPPTDSGPTPLERAAALASVVLAASGALGAEDFAAAEDATLVVEGAETFFTTIWMPSSSELVSSSDSDSEASYL